MAEKKKVKAPTFEESLARLEKLVGEMESGQLDLEKMMSHFEEGNQLVKFCSNKLNEVEKKVELLVKKGENVAVEPFVTEDDD